MGIRLTGISTPFGGAEWEYTDTKNNIEYTSPFSIIPDQKIKVFISSICGDNGKFDRVRINLKKAIEETQLADVYLFESEEASSLSAQNHYIWSLEDCDVCIFLIDNADGVTAGVQKEVDTARRCNIKSIYYFCDETSTKKTALEESLMGAAFAKSKTVHRFDELSEHGAKALISDIIMVYHSYCRGHLVPGNEETIENIYPVDLPQNANISTVLIPKAVLKDIGKCTEYILQFALGFSEMKLTGEEIKTCELDEWGEQLLKILFEGQSVRSFNMAMFLDTLKTLQDETYYSIVSLRWKAIQSYLLDDVEKSIQLLETALEEAKNKNQPLWVIQDILIDLRNQHIVYDTTRNCFTESSAQKELNESKENIYYPILDRFHEILREKYVNGIYKKRIESPYSITLGSNYSQFGELLASSFIVAIYNGSLTHILAFYENIKEFIFYLSCKYDDWKFRKDLLKFAIFAGNEKEIQSIQNSFPEVLNEMSCKDASEILHFCNNHTITYKRIRSQLLAFGTVGYYLDELEFKLYEKQILDFIKEWLNQENGVVALGYSVFKCLSGISYRMSPDDLAEICCMFIENHYRRWYLEMFRFIGNRVDLNKMRTDSAQMLIRCIISVLADETDRKQLSYDPAFLYIFRNQNRDLTNELDDEIHKHMPKFYNGIYKLETTENKEDNIEFIQRYVNSINDSNNKQGKDGIYFEHGTREIATVRAILMENNVEYPHDLIDKVISVIADTLLVSKEGINTKLDAVSLLICIAIKYPEDYIRNKGTYDQIIQKRMDIQDIDNTIISSNIDKVAIAIALALLNCAMGGDGYIEFMEGIACLQNNTATTISVMRIINEYLGVDDDIVLPSKIESIVLQNVLQWLRDDYQDIRWNAARIMFKLMRNEDNRGLINQKILELIDSESVYIKNLILRQVFEIEGIFDTTQEYVRSKCRHDPCFVVRMVCEEMEKKQEAAIS